MHAREEITQLLIEVSEGQEAAWEPLMAKVYDELRQLAHGRLRFERRGHTLGTTALVHEAYLKLVNLDRLQWQNRGQFFAIASQAMRRILVDYARTAKRLKRGGGQAPVSLDAQQSEPLPMMTEEDADDMLALDDALDRLGAVSTRQQQVVELRFFSGLTIQETAEVLGVGLNTVKRDWSTARAWLNRELG
ncbi:MAG TPA: ECF-type sigma factor [Rhodothermales bacterium]|nr:ECF-type sigma factor [Rhodothermales bacterium]